MEKESGTEVREREERQNVKSSKKISASSAEASQRPSTHKNLVKIVEIFSNETEVTTESEKVAESNTEDSRVTVERSEGAKSLTEKSQVLNTKCEKTKSKTEVIQGKQKVRTTISPGIIKIKNVFEKD